MYTPDQVKAYLDGNPQVRDSTAQWLQQQGEKRSVYQWVMDDMNNNPNSVHVQQMKSWQNTGAANTQPDLDPTTLNDLIAKANAGDATAIKTLTDAGYENTQNTQPLPLEQGLLNQYLPRLIGDADNDANRQALADKLAGTLSTNYTNTVDALSPEANAARLKEELAQADTTGKSVSDSAATSAADQLKALQDSIGAMQTNLTGDLATKAAALQTQIASLTSNLSTLDASQKAALAKQIETTQQDLNTSIASQQQNLTTEVASLRGAADAQSVARRNALQQEIDGLTAAQVPMAKARIDSANALATAVNIGLQSTTDQLDATRAKQGYIGSSSFDSGNLARASIGARQQAAQALGGARELNAGDTRTIQARNATEGRVIGDELANNQLGISGTAATGAKSLADLLATGTQSIGDTGAAGTAAITNNTANSLAGINNSGANQTFQDQVFGADQQRSLADALAKGGGTIGTTLAQQQQQARDGTAAAKQGYFDNSYSRGLGEMLTIPGLTSGLTSSLSGLDNYANSGLNRSLNTLNWWSAPGTAPTAGATATTADNTGNQISSLGAGLLGGAVNYGAANNWWAPKKTTTTATGTSLGDMTTAMNSAY